jgi:phosphoribosylanthranilate isomerase
VSGGAARVRVKICGLTSRENALEAIRLGADALGFNLYPGSKRYLALDREAEWIRSLPPFVTRVAVLVNASPDEALRVAAHPSIDIVQFHGDEDEGYCEKFARAGRPFIKALRLRDAASIASAAHFSTGNLLLDADAGGAFGGTGTLIDLGLAAECVRRHPELRFTLAGGLKPENVANAVRMVRPYAVDVASGVESAPGIKETEKMKAFIAAVKSRPI